MAGKSVRRVAGRTLQSNRPLNSLGDVTTACHLEHASVRLGGRWIWRDVTLNVAPGEFIAVLRPNGAGKSTLIKAMLGVLPLTEGSLSVFGDPARRGNRRIGYLPQRRSFDPDLRIRGRDLVRLGLTVRAGECRCHFLEVQQKKRIVELTRLQSELVPLLI